MQKSLLMQTDFWSSCLGGWSEMTFEKSLLDLEVLTWCGKLPNSLHLVDGYIPAPIAYSLKTCKICVKKLSILDYPFSVVRLRCTFAIFLLSILHFWYATPVASISAKLTNTDLKRLVTNIWDIWVFVYKKKITTKNGSKNKSIYVDNAVMIEKFKCLSVSIK